MLGSVRSSTRKTVSNAQKIQHLTGTQRRQNAFVNSILKLRNLGYGIPSNRKSHINVTQNLGFNVPSSEFPTAYSESYAPRYVDKLYGMKTNAILFRTKNETAIRRLMPFHVDMIWRSSKQSKINFH